MYFCQLKYVLLLAAASTASASDIAIVPPLFEDFAGTSIIRLYSTPSRGVLSANWRIESLVLSGELQPEPVVVRRIGLRTRESDGLGPNELNAVLTLSTTTATRLRRRYSENTGASPITYFTRGVRSSGAPPELRTVAQRTKSFQRKEVR